MGALHLIAFSFCLIIPFFSSWAEIINQTEQEKVKNEPTGIWHSYFFNTGVGNREGLHFSKIQLEELNIPVAKNVKKWTVLQNHKKTSIVGLTDESFILINYNANNDFTSSKTHLPGKPSDITLFQNWNATSQQMEGYAVVAVNMNNNDSWLNWYRINENEMVYLWNWPVHRNISHLEVIKLNEELKLLMITHGITDMKNPSADVYSFVMAETFDLWFFNRILLDEVPSSVVVCNYEDYVFLSVSLPKNETVQVFQYSSLSGEKYFRSHQKIQAKNVRSLISFRISFKWYLGVASSSSAIYRFNGNGVLTPVVQELGDIDHWLRIPVSTYRQDVIILAKKENEIAVISGVENGEFKSHGNLSDLICQEESSCLKNMNKISLKGSSSFYKGNHQVIFPSSFDHLSVLTFSVMLQPLLDVVTMEVNEVLEEKKNLEEMIKSQQLETEKLLNASKFLLNSNNEIELSNKWIIENLIAVEIDVPNLEKVNIKNLEIGKNQNWTKEDFSVNIDKLKAEIASLKNQIKEMKSKIKLNEIESNELDKDISEIINNGIIADGVVYVDELEVDEINGVDVNKILAETYRLDRPQKIKGTKTISDLDVDDVYFSKLNGIPAEDILYADDVWEGNNVINGDLLFENDLHVIGNFTLFPGGLVNNLRLQSDIPDLNKKFNGTLKFEDVEILEESNIKNINKWPFILPIHNSPYDIHTLDNVNQARIEQVIVENDLNVTFINGKNFTELMEQIVLKTGNSKENFSMDLNGTLSASNIEIEYLNGIKFPEGFVLASSEDPVIIDGEKTFTGNLTVDNIDIEFDGTEERSVNDYTGANVRVFQNLEIVGILTVDMINDKNWDYYNDIVKIDEKNPILTGEKNFTKSLKAETIQLIGKINNKSIDDILTNGTDQIFKAPQVFTAAVFKNLTVNGTYDGVCIKCLNESINGISSEEEIYPSNLIFENSTCEFDELNILESLNDNIMPGNNTLVLNGDIKLQSVKTKILNINGSLNTFGKLNNINLTEFDINRLSLTKPQIIDHDIFHPNVTLRGNISVFSINNQSIEPGFEEENFDDILQKIIDGKADLKTVTVKGNITTNDNINNVNLTEFSKNAVNIKKEDSFPGDITFEDKIKFKELDIGGRIDGVDLKKLKRDVVRRGSPIFSRGAKNFTNGIKIIKNLRIRTLNGHLMGDVATFEGDHLMNSSWVINGDVTVRGNLTLHGSLNDLSIQDLQRKYSTEYKSYIVPGDIVFKGNGHIIKELIVGGKVNNVDFEDFMSELVWKDKDVNISGSMTFLNEVSFDGNLTVKKTINQLDFTKFSKDVVLKNEPAKIEGKIILKSPKIKNLIVENDFNSTLIHDRDTEEWLEECIPLDKDVFVSEFKFFQNIDAHGDISADFINGHSPENMITLKDDQYISEPMQFLKINVTSDVQVDGDVNGRNLKDEYDNTVMVHGDQTIYGKITFMNDLVVDGDVSISSADGVNLENLTTLHTDQVIKTEIEFQGPVTVNGNIEDLRIINDIDLHEWNESSVFLNREQSINGTWTILGNVTMMKNVEGDALLNSMSIPLLAKQVEKRKFLASQQQNELELEYQTQCRRLQNISSALTHQPYLFKQFDLIQVLDAYLISERAKFDLSIESVITFKAADNNNYLILTFVDECFEELYRWDETSSKYIYLDKINLGPVHKWIVINHKATSYLITTSAGAGVLCEDYLKPGNIWSFDEEGRYGHVFTTEAFTDIIPSKNFSDTFYTLAKNGSIFEWILQGSSPPKCKFLIDVGKGDYRFVDFEITNGLTVARSSEIKKIDEPYLEILNENRIPGLNDGEMASLPINGKIFTAVARRHQVIIYDDILKGDVVSVIHARNPTSLNWIYFGPGKEMFLIFRSRNRVFEVFEYKGAAGFKRKMSRAILSQRIQSVTLPDENKSESRKYIIIVAKKKMFLLKAQMFGHLHDENDISC